jgi:threonine dehydratase
MITPDDIVAAAARIAGYVRRTPVLDVPAGTCGAVTPLALKLEHHQVSGSFKGRGAHNLLLSDRVPPAGVVAASGGNFGVAIAYAAHVLGQPATIFLPDITAPAKRARLASLGADVRIVPGVYADALTASAAHAHETGARSAHAYDQPEIVAGAGTVARELEDQRPELDTVLVAVGGGGLIGGIASWYGARVRIVAVETEGTPTLHKALAAGAPVDVEVTGVAADSLGARRIGALAWAARDAIDASVLVTDDAVRDAQARLWHECRIACEPASAAPLAALVAGAYTPEPDERVALLICGANVDPATLA